MDEPRKAVIIVQNDPAALSRVLKQMKALTEAGYDATAVGILRYSSDSLDEKTEHGRIVRVRTTEYLHTERATADSGEPGTPSKRRSEGVRFIMGRIRENVLLARVARTLEPDVVITSDLTAVLAGLLVRRHIPAALLYDVRDVRTAADGNATPVARFLMRRFESRALRMVDATTCVSPAMARWLKGYHRLKEAPIAVYNGAFTRMSAPKPARMPLRLFFQGRFVRNRRLEDLVMAMPGLRGVATLTLQGWGEMEHSLRALVQDQGLDDVVTFRAPCSPHEVVRCAADYDIGIVNYPGSTTNLRVAVPIKLMDYLSAGLAVLASDLAPLREIVERHECGLVFEPTGPDVITEAIRSLSVDPHAVTVMKQRALDASAEYSWDTQGQVFVGIIDGLLEGKR